MADLALTKEQIKALADREGLNLTERILLEYILTSRIRNDTNILVDFVKMYNYWNSDNTMPKSNMAEVARVAVSTPWVQES